MTKNKIKVQVVSSSSKTELEKQLLDALSQLDNKEDTSTTLHVTFSSQASIFSRKLPQVKGKSAYYSRQLVRYPNMQDSQYKFTITFKQSKLLKSIIVKSSMLYYTFTEFTAISFFVPFSCPSMMQEKILFI